MTGYLDWYVIVNIAYIMLIIWPIRWKCMFQNLMQHMVYRPVSVCTIAPVCFGLLWELVLSLADTVSEAVVCMVEQILEIVL